MEININPSELRKNCRLFLSTPMYGGGCSGLYTRSMCDLITLFTQMQIPIVLYYLFNESLITRARAYSADAFMRSDCTHMIFIDSDISFNPQDILAMLALMTPDSPYDILGGPYPKKCLPNNTKIITEDGKKTISQIVNEKYKGLVLSFNNEDKNYEWNKITNHFVEPNYGKKWVSIQTSKIRPRSSIISTFDHEIAYIDDVFNPIIKYDIAENLKDKFIIKKPKIYTYNNKNNIWPLLNKEQLSVLIGSSLGDGHISSDGRYMCNHGMAQHEYNNYKYEIIGGCFKIKENGSFHYFTNEQTKILRNLIYDGKQKTLKNIINYIDEIALAHIYMDDGNRACYPEIKLNETSDKTWWYNEYNETKRSVLSPGNNWKRGRKDNAWRAKASIATMSFTYEDNLLLKEYISKKWNIDCYILGNEINKYYLMFDADNTEKFYDLIAPYIHESMNYKINPEFWEKPKIKINNKHLSFCAQKVIAIENFIEPTNSKLYDIEVENNHNFVINDGYLVHNCIAWEKILQAVDKGFHKEEHGGPNNLENFIGDYVFNPVAGNHAIQISEPAEVMELGTGFMMIKRSTFELFNKHYPQYSYKPDHIRTADFDGSREIMMYFQAEIDRYDPINLFKETLEGIASGKVISTLQAQEALDKYKKLSENDTKRYLSEDYFFTQMIRKAGGRAWLCPWIQLKHVGSFVFGGSLAHLAAAGSSATCDPASIGKG